MLYNRVRDQTACSRSIVKRLCGGEPFISSDKEFAVSAFFKPINPGPLWQTIYFDASDLPNYRMALDGKIYDYNYDKKEVLEISDLQSETNMSGIIERRSGTKIDVSKQTATEGKRFADLMINLVSYINAKNVAIVRQGRGGRQRRVMLPGGIESEGGRPYSWIDIKKSYVRYPEGEPTGWKLQNRVWVIGHERHFSQTPDDWIWIEPHIKGPENAPWHYRRYAALYEKLGPTLRRRGNEQVGSWVNDK